MTGNPLSHFEKAEFILTCSAKECTAVRLKRFDIHVHYLVEGQWRWF